MEAASGGSRVARLFDRIYSERNHRVLQRLVVILSVIGFVVHLLAIELARDIENPPHLIERAGKNYLAAIYTPFSFILFYEVLVLISSIPDSNIRSLASQYQIVSMIFIRGFFKDIASLNLSDLDLAEMHEPLRDMTPDFIDVSTGLFMFLLVTIFRRVATRAPADAWVETEPAFKRFVEWKKMAALALTGFLIWLAISTLWKYELELFHPAPGIGASRAAFYSDIFTAMIFTDVLMLLLSLLISDKYESVFLNASFVISAVLIRFSLTAVHPYGAVFGVAGMLFGICALLIFSYNARLPELR